MKTSSHRFTFKPSIKIMAAIALMLSAGLGFATDIYRWTDEQGHTHISDSIPERYKAAATRTDSKQFELSESQRKAAAARIAKERERQAALDAEKASAEAAEKARAEAARNSSPTPGSAASGPTGQPPSATECTGLWREYFKSQECFAPYRLSGGGIKAEAFDHCTQIVSPAQQCGRAKVIGSH